MNGVRLAFHTNMMSVENRQGTAAVRHIITHDSENLQIDNSQIGCVVKTS